MTTTRDRAAVTAAALVVVVTGLLGACGEAATPQPTQHARQPRLPQSPPFAVSAVHPTSHHLLHLRRVSNGQAAREPRRRSAAH